MQPSVWIPLVTCVASATVASAITAHNIGARANRLIALVLAGTAWWALCEVLWNIQVEPEQVLWLVKAAALGWMILGPLLLDLFTEIQCDPRSWLRRLVPVAYISAAVSIVVFVATPWGLTHAFQTRWGWSYGFGPLFPPLYLATVGWIGVTILNWRRLFATTVAHERAEVRRALVGIGFAASVATLTEVILPFMQVEAPHLGSTASFSMTCMIAWGVKRYGYFLIAPGSFAPEILAALRDGVALLYADGSVRTCNEGLARMVDLPPESIIGSPVAHFLPELAEMGFEDSLEDAEMELWPHDGQPFPVSVSSSHLEGRGERPGRVLAVRDLREVTALRKRLVTSGRLAAVGELAAGIAHEIANPVTFVRANLVELRRDWETLREAVDTCDDEPGLEEIVAEAGEVLEESIHGVDRITSIVRNVGAFSHAGRVSAEPIDVNALLDNVLDVASLSFSVMVERCYGDLPRVLGHPQQLKQAFLNLVLNALQAVGDFGRIRLTTQARAEGVTVRVQDDGPGIPAEALERVFDPFFTTRPGEALGLGLAQCFQIVRAHGGEVSAYSTPGRGSVFEVRLPRADD